MRDRGKRKSVSAGDRERTFSVSPCLSMCPYATDIRLCSWMDWDMRLKMTHPFLRSHQNQVSLFPMLRNTFSASRSICKLWCELQSGTSPVTGHRDRAGADNPQTIAHLDCKGIKNRVLFVSGPSLKAPKTLELLCCYLVIVPRLNYWKDL